MLTTKEQELKEIGKHIITECKTIADTFCGATHEIRNHNIHIRCSIFEERYDVDIYTTDWFVFNRKKVFESDRNGNVSIFHAGKWIYNIESLYTKALTYKKNNTVVNFSISEKNFDWELYKSCHLPIEDKNE